MAPRREKRRRPAGQSQGQRESQRPDPPPPPPPSLVRLIQKDAAVLEYFQALQTNLDFDVKKWKARAKALEEERETLHSQLTASRLERQSTTNYSPPSKLHNNDVPGPGQSTGTQSKRQASYAVHQPIINSLSKPSADTQNDEDFHLEFSSSSSESQVDASITANNRQPPKASFGFYKTNSNLDLNLSSSEDEDEGDVLRVPKPCEPLPNQQPRLNQLEPGIKFAVDQLFKVSGILQELGIELLEQQPVKSNNPTPICESNEAEAIDMVPPTRLILRRRPDQDVVVDILQFVKALTRVKHVVSQNETDLYQAFYYPFMTKEYIPCYIPSVPSSRQCAIEHPAVVGVEKLLTCLCYMDVFCPILDRIPGSNQTSKETLEVNSTDDDDDDDNKIKRLLLEMKDRQTLTERLLQSLEGEIIKTWGVQDRSTRILTKAVHLVPEADHEQHDSDSSDEELLTKSIKAIPFNSKNFVRLAAIVERCILAKLVTTLYLFRKDHYKAFQLLLGYITSTAPALLMEDYPKLPPVQSFCVLEAILNSTPPTVLGPSSQSKNGTLLHWMEDSKMPQLKSFQGILCLVMKSTAQIYEIRNAPNLDDRIRDLSRVELAAYARIIKCPIFPKYKYVLDSTMSFSLSEELESFLGDGTYQRDVVATSLAFLLEGDATKIDKSWQQALEAIKCTNDNARSFVLQEQLFVCIYAKKELEIRRLEDHRQIVLTPMIVEPSHTGNLKIQLYSKQLVDWLVTQEFNSVSELVVPAFRCCQSTSDGESVFKLAEWSIQHLQKIPRFNSELFPILDALESTSHALTIRVINLSRRPDRLAAFLSQVLNEQVNILKGLACFTTSHNQLDDDLPYEHYFGNHAIDGQGKASDVERRLVQLVGGKQDDLNKLVETHWVPNELKPFDSDAPDSDKMVLISASEKACAISHIACWKGVERSLARMKSISESPLLRYPDEMGLRFLISGFARGESLFPTDMEPSPVCVILEDDAILVDRFADRLTSLLDELPRDFHFCSIGYSRPKTAPLVPFSAEISIPTSIWYLTGYILSLEGARYLLKKLPVRGPIDSWIGLAMFSNNWDNVFGHALGVGVSSKPPQDPAISRQDLRKILRFRAFAASVPLCSQKVGNIATLPSTGRSWRQRDTDIVYSGNAL